MENNNSKSLEELPEVLTTQHLVTYLQISRCRVYELFQMNEDAGGIPAITIELSKRVEKGGLCPMDGQEEVNKLVSGSKLRAV